MQGEYRIYHISRTLKTTSKLILRVAGRIGLSAESHMESVNHADMIKIVKKVAYEENISPETKAICLSVLQSNMLEIITREESQRHKEQTDGRDDIMIAGKEVRYCEYCGSTRSGSAKFCPNCGEPVAVDKPQHEKKVIQNENAVAINETDGNPKFDKQQKKQIPLVIEEDSKGESIRCLSGGAIISPTESGSGLLVMKSDHRVKALIIISILILLVGGIWYFNLGRERDVVRNSGVLLSNQVETTDKTVMVEKKKETNSKDEASLDYRWFISKPKGFLIWNPKPQPGETVEWDGGGIEDEKVKGRYYANGHGTATWRVNGEFVQSDSGVHRRGMRSGVITQRFADGRILTSRWDAGTKEEP